jgi:tRNA A-37 threonylcarbamoyl transferase component Bud32
MTSPAQPRPIVLGNKVGAGADGDVYQATDGFGRKVAVKVLRDPDSARGTIFDHAQRLAMASHPAIVTLFAIEHVVFPDSEAPQLGIVMEFLEGDTADQYLAEHTPDTATALRWSHVLVDAIRSLHESDSYHGDLHAGNVLITRHGLRIIDILYRPSQASFSTKTRTQHLEQDLRETRNLILRFAEASGGHAFRQTLSDLIASPLSLDSLEKAILALSAQRSQYGSTASRDLDRATYLRLASHIDSNWIRNWHEQQGSNPQYLHKRYLDVIRDYVNSAELPENAWVAATISEAHDKFVIALREFLVESSILFVPANNFDGEVFLLSAKDAGQRKWIEDYDKKYQSQIDTILRLIDHIWSAWGTFVKLARIELGDFAGFATSGADTDADFKGGLAQDSAR